MTTKKNILTVKNVKQNFFLKSVLLGSGISALLLLVSCRSGKSFVDAPATPIQTQNDPTQPKMPAGEQVLLTFCMDEAFDMPGEYMAGLGIAEDRLDRSRAILDANRIAIADIASRYVGMIKNAIEDYSKDVTVLY